MKTSAQPWKKMLEMRKGSEKNETRKTPQFYVVTGSSKMESKQELAQKREKLKREIRAHTKAKEDLEKEIEDLIHEVSRIESELGK